MSGCSRMVGTTGLPSGATLAKAKKAAAAKKPRARSAASQPRTIEMVRTAIKELKDASGSSLQAIKKYIAATYQVDAEKMTPLIKKYAKTAVAGKKMVVSKGKLSLADAKQSRPKRSASKKPRAAKKSPKKSPVKKSSPKKKATLKTLAAKPPKPKPAKKPAAKKAAASKAKKSPVKKARKV